MTQYDDYGMPVGVAYPEPEGLTVQAWRVTRAFFVYRVRPLAERRYSALRRRWSLRRAFSLVNVLVVVWLLLVYWGERRVFHSAVESCDWNKWEDWEPGANPHRIALVADPQLVDPHTYPGRPWPLNPLTISYTDRYMRRTYSRIQSVLYPDTVFFLGDLFDGGREWSTRTTSSPEKQYQEYGDSFWQREYRRFGDLFFAPFTEAGTEARPGKRGRKIISSLPGNHDLGFARGVQLGVRNRFNAYFGDGNRIDVLGNHTFVSIDSVSLSALGQPSPAQVEDIWKPTSDFLASAKDQKHRLIQRELRTQRGLPPNPLYEHRDIPASDLPKATLPHAHSSDTTPDFPTILLTHVPLYRPPGTPCGPHREHWPPTPPAPGQPPLDRDDRNAISVSGGYQYQNVLNSELSASIATQLGDISLAFSGDDHDYCDVTHRSYASAGGGIREVTVKSISMAMGVRLPGIVLLSLWNPVDAAGVPINTRTKTTTQTHLCVLPDQLSVFIRYAQLFALTLLLLAARAASVAMGYISPSFSGDADDARPLLPVTNTANATTSTQNADRDTKSSHRHSSGAAVGRLGALARGGFVGSGGVEAWKGVDDDGGEEKGRRSKGRGNGREGDRVGIFLREMKGAIGAVVVVGGLWYFGLMWVG